MFILVATNVQISHDPNSVSANKVATAFRHAVQFVLQSQRQLKPDETVTVKAVLGSSIILLFPLCCVISKSMVFIEYLSRELTAPFEFKVNH